MRLIGFILSNIFLSLIILSSNAFSQSSGELSTKTNFWSGLQVYEGDHKLSKADVRQKLSTNPEALDLYNKGKSQHRGASVLGALSGGCISYGLGIMIYKNKDDGAALVGIGLAGAIGRVIVHGIGSRNIKTAINLYNNLNATGFNPKPYQINLILSGNGIGIGLAF